MLFENSTGLLAGLSILSAAISTLLKPHGHDTFIQDVKQNLLFLSPARPAAIVISIILNLIGWRVLNIAGLCDIPWLLAGCFFLDSTPSALSYLEQASWSHFARRGFLLGATLPLCVMLLASTSPRWLCVPVTFILAECLLVEILTFYREISSAGLIFRPNWPNNVLVRRSRPAVDLPRHGHVDQSRGTDKNRDKDKSQQPLCERVRQIWVPSAGHQANQTERPLELEVAQSVVDILPESFIPRQTWTCGHWRCLVHIVLRTATRALMISPPGVDLALAAWLLHHDLRPVTLYAASVLLNNRLIHDLLTILYTACIIWPVCYFIYRLCLVLATLLYRQLSVLQRAGEAFVTLTANVPISRTALRLLATVLIAGFFPYAIGGALFPWIPKLTETILAYAANAILIPIIYIKVSRLARGMKKSGYASVEPQSESIKPPSSSESSVAPNTEGRDPQSPKTTDRPLERPKDEQKTSRSGDGYKEAAVAFDMFRLAVLLPSAAIWLFLYY